MNNPVVARITDPAGNHLTDVTAQQATYLWALLSCSKSPNYAEYLEIFNKYYPGGAEGAIEDIHPQKFYSMNLFDVFSSIGLKFQDAPWRKPTPPKIINGHNVQYTQKGIVVGCTKLSLEAMELMVKECKDAF